MKLPPKIRIRQHALAFEILEETSPDIQTKEGVSSVEKDLCPSESFFNFENFIPELHIRVSLTAQCDSSFTLMSLYRECMLHLQPVKKL